VHAARALEDDDDDDDGAVAWRRRRWRDRATANAFWMRAIKKHGSRAVDVFDSNRVDDRNVLL
jgi:hypothetical protein